MFEWNEEEGRLEALHHPFTAPHPDDLAAGDLRGARALAYDLVYNGVEVAGARGAARSARLLHLEARRRDEAAAPVRARALRPRRLGCRPWRQRRRARAPRL